MPSTRIYKRVMNRPEDLMHLVSNVQDYPKFINLMSAVRISNRKELAPGVESFQAETTISYKFIREDFSSIVTVDHNDNSINVGKANRGGAVRSLKNNWIFYELSDGSTLVDFFVEVRLKAFPLEMLLRDKFDQSGEHLMNLFVKKAGQLYPKVGQDDLNMPAELARLDLSPTTACV